MIYNLLQVVRGYAAQASPEPVKVNELSTEKLFLDRQEELVALHRMLKGERLREVLPLEERTQAVQARLRALLKQAWTPSWKKARPGKPRPPQPTAKELGAHTSVHKILQEARQQRDKTPINPLKC